MRRTLFVVFPIQQRGNKKSEQSNSFEFSPT